MTPLAQGILLAWIPLVLTVFAVVPARRAVLITFLAGWLLLPVGSEGYFRIEGLPDYDKMSATCAAVLLGALLFDPDTLTSFRFRLLDLPMAVWCLCPIATSLANGLGLYDGAATALQRCVEWAGPYLIGRLYLRDAAAMRELGVAIFIAGLLYMPLVLWEIRMSPQLHQWLYGFRQHPFMGSVRFNGWRPEVFTGSGLMLAMWMVTATLVAWRLATTGAVQRVLGIPAMIAAAGLGITTVLCKSLGAILLLLAGAAALHAARRFNTRALLWGLALTPVLYIGLRAGGLWTGDALLQAAACISEDRAESLETRLVNEDILAAHALKRPFLGWGGWGRNRPDKEDVQHTIADGFWVIALGENGLLGLASVTAVQLLPALLLLLRFPARAIGHPALAAPVAMAVLLLLYAIDNLMNAMVNPLFMLMAGGLTALLLNRAPSPRPMGVFARQFPTRVHA